MKINESTIIKGFFLILVPTVFLFLIVHVSVLTGVMKEREERECITHAQVNQWKSVINVAEGIYLNVAEDYHAQIEALEGQVKYWKDSYLWNQGQLTSCQEGNTILQDKLFN